jgi:hypothetical protein
MGLIRNGPNAGGNEGDGAGITPNQLVFAVIRGMKRNQFQSRDPYVGAFE